MSRKKTDRGFSHGVTFDRAMLASAIALEAWEADFENSEMEVRRVWLGTIFGITPSGKFYQPFACSNVTGDCPVCGGSGTIKPRTGKRIRARNAEGDAS